MPFSSVLCCCCNHTLQFIDTPQTYKYHITAAKFNYFSFTAAEVTIEIFQMLSTTLEASPACVICS